MAGKRTKEKGAPAGARNDMEMFYSVGDTREEREHALARFVEDVEDGRPPARHVLEFIAEGIGTYLENGDPGWLKRGKGREPSSRRDFKNWACWFALRCDRELMGLPTGDDGAPDAAAAAVRAGVGGKRMRDLARAFDEAPRASDGFLLAIHWPRYAAHRGWPETEETYARMVGMYADWRDACRKLAES